MEVFLIKLQGDIQKVRSLKAPEFWVLLSLCSHLFVFEHPHPHPLQCTFVLVRSCPLHLNFYILET